MNSSRCVIPAIILFLCCFSQFLYAAPPNTISYQGYLKDATGKPVTAATNLTFRLYSTTSGAGPVWQEGRSVTPANGVYSVGLGEVTPLTVVFNRQYYLGIQIGTNPEMRPLQMLMAVPYALHAVHAGCYPGDMLTCYTGPPETLNQGLCKGGIRTCTPDGSGFGTCTGEFTPNCNGACLDFSSNVTNCGACGTVCSFSNSIPACQNSICVISSCTSGWGNCDGNAANGCETSLTNAANNCGTCGNVCSSINGTPSCTSGVCNIACNTGWANCNLNAADGCENNITDNLSNCGACGHACSSANGTPSCNSGVCNIACNSGWANCNLYADDGCEINITNSVTNCGTCGNDCYSRPHVTSAGCSSGACTILGCTLGWSNADANVVNGCEYLLNSNPSCYSDASNLGNVSGDTGSSSLTRSDHGEKWLYFTLTEDDSSILERKYLSATITLTPPPDTDYDLYVYCASCGGSFAGSSTQRGSSVEQVNVRWDDTLGVSNDGKVYVEVRYYSGSSAANWNLHVLGNTTVSVNTCPTP